MTLEEAIAEFQKSLRFSFATDAEILHVPTETQPFLRNSILLAFEAGWSARDKKEDYSWMD